jgi:hypothetical protein
MRAHRFAQCSVFAAIGNAADQLKLNNLATASQPRRHLPGEANAGEDTQSLCNAGHRIVD